MATFHLQIDTSGAAFTDELGEPSPAAATMEVARILSVTANRLRLGATIDEREALTLRDANGNTVGHAGLVLP